MTIHSYDRIQTNCNRNANKAKINTLQFLSLPCNCNWLMSFFNWIFIIERLILSFLNLLAKFIKFPFFFFRSNGKHLIHRYYPIWNCELDLKLESHYFWTRLFPELPFKKQKKNTKTKLAKQNFRSFLHKITIHQKLMFSKHVWAFSGPFFYSLFRNIIIRTWWCQKVVCLFCVNWIPHTFELHKQSSKRNKWIGKCVSCCSMASRIHAQKNQYSQPYKCVKDECDNSKSLS